MSTGREAHNESVEYARAEISGIANQLLAIQARLDTVLGSVMVAVGDPPATDSGRNAFEFTALLGDRIEEMLRIADNIGSELTRYSGGF